MRAVPVRMAAMMLMALAGSGCRAWRVETVPPRELLKTPGVEAVRVTRFDKSKVEIWDPVLQGDSIVGHPTERAIARLVMPLAQVETISVRKKSFGRTLLIGLGIVGAVTIYALLQELNQGY
jgi:hypothetical protein